MLQNVVQVHFNLDQALRTIDHDVTEVPSNHLKPPRQEVNRKLSILSYRSKKFRNVSNISPFSFS